MVGARFIGIQCMHVFTYAGAYICTYVRMQEIDGHSQISQGYKSYACAYARTYICIYVCMRACKQEKDVGGHLPHEYNTHVRMYTYVHMYLCIYVCM